GLGCAAVDDLLYVPSYPPSDGKLRVTRHERACGGLTAAALIAAARLGARCAYAGCLGDDDASRFIAQSLQREGVDLSHAPHPDGAAVIRSTIIVAQDTGSRTIFFQAEGMIGAHPTLPAEDVIRASKVLLIDHYGMEGNLRAARIARGAGVAVVADFENEAVPLFEEVLAWVDHLILSEAFACRITRCREPSAAARALWGPQRAAVVVTCGARGCWSVSESSGLQPQHQPAFAVTASNTTGCGDVFHGAYAAALARGDSLEQRLRFASAAAALKASQREIPNLRATQEFLSKHHEH
ncbi:MAG: PfkB family carbohydrate kinase, partial [Verrucomicrobiae bacterium]|nr:PfkB family carbohydrate kinase [Verrucomicrobiae bacterium]